MERGVSGSMVSQPAGRAPVEEPTEGGRCMPPLCQVHFNHLSRDRESMALGLRLNLKELKAKVHGKYDDYKVLSLCLGAQTRLVSQCLGS